MRLHIALSLRIRTEVKHANAQIQQQPGRAGPHPAAAANRDYDPRSISIQQDEPSRDYFLPSRTGEIFLTIWLMGMEPAPGAG